MGETHLAHGTLQNKSLIVIYEINWMKLEQLARNGENYKKQRLKLQKAIFSHTEKDWKTVL